MASDYTYIIPQGYNGSCVGYLKSIHKYSSRVVSYLKQHEGLKINGESRIFTTLVKGMDEISIHFPDEISSIEPESHPIDIVYEDQDILVVNKEPGIVVHPTKSYQSHTLSNFIAGYWMGTGTKSIARFVNRIDRDTSGVVIIAKNKYVHNFIQKSFIAGDNLGQKTYVALLEGIPPELEGEINEPIGRESQLDIRRQVMEGAKESRTVYKVLSKNNGHSLALLRLYSGRTHQIRVHMAYIGCSVAGDELYSGNNSSVIGRLALHCLSMTALHPRTNENMRFVAKIPKDILDAAEGLGLDVPEGILS